MPCCVARRGLWAGAPEGWPELGAEVEALARRLRVPVGGPLAGAAAPSGAHFASGEPAAGQMAERLRGLVLLVDDLPHHLLLPRCVPCLPLPWARHDPTRQPRVHERQAAPA